LFDCFEKLYRVLVMKTSAKDSPPRIFNFNT